MRELPTYPPSSDPLSPAHPEIPGTGQDLVCKPQLYVHCTPRLPDYGDTDMRVERTPGPPGRRPRPHCQPTKSLLPTIQAQEPPNRCAHLSPPQAERPFPTAQERTTPPRSPAPSTPSPPPTHLQIWNHAQALPPPDVPQDWSLEEAIQLRLAAHLP